MLYNPELAKIPGVNPLIMDSLKDYKEYVKWQRASGLNCPILHLEKVYDSKETNNTKSSVHLPVKIKIYKLVR